MFTVRAGLELLLMHLKKPLCVTHACSLPILRPIAPWHGLGVSCICWDPLAGRGHSWAPWAIAFRNSL